MVTLGWFVCLSVSMVTTNRTAGLEKTVADGWIRHCGNLH